MRAIGADERSTMTMLSVDECLALLRWEPIGRLGVGVRGQAPIVVPVNITVCDDASIVFRADDGAHLDRIRNQPVSVQVDRFDWYRRIGWSVLVRGTACEFVPDDADDLKVEPWAPGPKQHWVRIIPTAVTGRRLALTDRPLDGRGYL